MRKWMRMGVPAALAAAALALGGCTQRTERQGSEMEGDEQRMRDDTSTERIQGGEPTQPFEGESREGYQPPPEPGTGGAGMEQPMGMDAGTGGAGFEEPQMGMDAGTGGAGFEEPQMGMDAGTGGTGMEPPPATEEQPSPADEY